MISPRELRQKAERLYLAFLNATIAGEPFFPRAIPCRKPEASDDFDQLQRGIQQLLQEAKNMQGFGYTVVLQQVKTRRHGLQSIPDKIVFENEEDFLKYLSKEDECQRFHAAVQLLLESLPSLRPWLQNKANKVLEYLESWPDLVKVCRYFLAHPKPNLYPRELPVEVHTKFIEQHQTILRSLLDFLLPGEAINAEENNFYKRFYLKFQEPLIRLRILDAELQRHFHFHDLSIPVSEFCHTVIPCSKVLIVENLMTFLTLPPLDKTVAIWGKGFQVELLRNATWLQGREIFYWGDLDAPGFQILSQLRGYFPQTRSLMMASDTFERFKVFCGKGMPAKVNDLPNLTADEKKLFVLLSAQNFRLEQEKIPPAYVMEVLRRLRG